MLAINRLKRKQGSKAAADEWEKLQETARLAEREGWHGVVHWHRKKGVSTSAAQSGSATSPDKTKPITSRESGLVFLVSLVAFVGLLAWLSR